MQSAGLTPSQVVWIARAVIDAEITEFVDSSERIMALTHEFKSRLFFSIMLIVAIAIVGGVTHRMSGGTDANAVLLALSVSLVGLIVWVFGRLKPKPVRKEAQAGEASDTDFSHEGPLTFARQPDYWGGILSLAGLLLATYILFFKKSTIVFTKTPPAQKLVVPAPLAKRPLPRFPDLKLEGLTLNGNNSSAVIDGQVVQLGEWIEGVQVIEIDNEGVCVELDGQTNQIHLTR